MLKLIAVSRYIISLFFIFLSFTCLSQNHSVKNLVFEGGGIRGLAYAGALIELENRNLLDSIERVAGTSAGAIAATLYSVGYQPKEILDLIYDLKIKSFADGRWIFIGGTRRLVRNFGWYRGDKFHKWIGELIKAKTGKENFTFQELHTLSRENVKFKQLYLTGTNLSQQKTEILCHETYPAMEVRTAVRISMSIPYYFQAVVIDESGKVCSKNDLGKGKVMVDGGITANYPIHIFDYSRYIHQKGDSTSVVNYQTLGFRLDTDEQIKCDKEGKGLSPVEIRKMKDFTQAFYNIVLENLNRHDLKKEDWKRTISISTGEIGPKIKKLSIKDKNSLIENGRRGTRAYFGNN